MTAERVRVLAGDVSMEAARYGGAGVPVLLLHGGPGLSDYTADLAAELSPLPVEVASFQQRGLTPSQVDGPFAVADHVADVGRVLDALGWAQTVLVGHSWGGHLALHVAGALPERVRGLLAVDPLGAVGDGGAAAFEAELSRRTPIEVRRRAEELDARAMAGEGTEAEALESLALIWPAYFPSWDAAPPMPPLRLAVPCYSETWSSVVDALPRLEASLPTLRCPVGFVAGELSPMPASASLDAAALVPGAWAEVVPGAGHFPWLDRPGSVRAALQRLLAQLPPLR